MAQIKFLGAGKSNKTVHALLRKKSKILPKTQQLKLCEALQISSKFRERRTIYVNNYFSTIQTKLRFFQITLQSRSVITNVQPAGLELLVVNCVHVV